MIHQFGNVGERVQQEVDRGSFWYAVQVQLCKSEEGRRGTHYGIVVTLLNRISVEGYVILHVSRRNRGKAQEEIGAKNGQSGDYHRNASLLSF